MSKGIVVGNVTITHQIVGDVLHLEVRSQDGGDRGTDVAIDTMLLAILQICCISGVEPKDVVTRTAFRMSEIARNMGTMITSEVDA